MTKEELVRQLAANRRISRQDARAFVEAFFHVVAKALSDGETVRLRGFGAFEARPRAGRVIRKRDGTERLVAPASLLPGFRWAPGLVRRLTDGEPQVRPEC